MGSVCKMAVSIDNVLLRPANKDDCEQVFKWQSNREIRRYSRNPESPDWERHLGWFTESLQSAKRQILIIEYKGNPAGVLRLDEVKDRCNTFEISIFVDYLYQKKGIARKALLITRENFSHSTFVAEIFKKNKASVCLFLSAGFKPLENSWYISRPEPEKLIPGHD